MITIHRSKVFWALMALAIAEIICFALGYYVAKESVPKKYYVYVGTKAVTPFHAVKAECDNDPDEASGGRVAINGDPTGSWFACNWLPFGTKIVVPDISGNKVWTCRDRMNKRFPHRVDLLLQLNERGFGLVWAKIYIVFVPSEKQDERNK